MRRSVTYLKLNPRPLRRAEYCRVYSHTEKFRFHVCKNMIKVDSYFQPLGQRQNPKKKDDGAEHLSSPRPKDIYL